MKPFVKELATPQGNKCMGGANTGTGSPVREEGTAYACDPSTYRREAGGLGVSVILAYMVSPAWATEYLK